MIYLTDIDEMNWRTPLSVRIDQEHFVANRTVLLARAYAYRNFRSRAVLILADEEPVGMALYYDLPEMNAYDLSQFFIDALYQGRGYGRRAAEMILDRMKQEKKYPKIVLCYKEGNEAARRLYESLGFKNDGDAEDGEIVMELLI